jgi:hypothetical protein
MKASTYTSSDSESSSSDDMNDQPYDPPQPQYSTAGVFMCKPNDRPLPLSSQRSIPLPRFWKLSSHHSSKLTEVAPDILRRTGSTTSTYSNESLGSRHNVPNKAVDDEKRLCIGGSAASGTGRHPEKSVHDAMGKPDFSPNKLKASRSMPLDGEPIVENSDDLQYSIYSSGNHNMIHFLKQRLGKCLVQRIDLSFLKSQLTTTIAGRQRRASLQ